LSSLRIGFERLDLVFSRAHELADGTPRLMGTTSDKLTVVELIGYGDVLSRTSLMVGFTKSDAESFARNTAALLLFLRALGWEEGRTWATESMKSDHAAALHGAVAYEMQKVSDGVFLFSARPASNH